MHLRVVVPQRRQASLGAICEGVRQRVQRARAAWAVFPCTGGGRCGVTKSAASPALEQSMKPIWPDG